MKCCYQPLDLAPSWQALVDLGSTMSRQRCRPTNCCCELEPVVQANEILHHKTTLNGYLAEFTGQPEDKIYIDTDRDWFLSAQESVEYGLIDGVSSKRNIALAAAALNSNGANGKVSLSNGA